MGNGKINQHLIPNVSKLPKHPKVDVSNKLKSANPNEAHEFKNQLNEQLLQKENNDHGVKLSAHAAKRLHDRDLNMDSDEFLKIKDAISKLKSKGGKDSLVVTNSAAYIVDVNNNKIVTAIDKNKMSENVFTKIDSTLFVN
jgi:flagellar operon protein